MDGNLTERRKENVARIIQSMKYETLNHIFSLKLSALYDKNTSKGQVEYIQDG